MDSSNNWLSSPLQLDLSLSLDCVTYPQHHHHQQQKEQRGQKTEANSSISPDNEAGSRSNSTREEMASGLVEELRRLTTENKRLKEMLTVVYGSYNSLKRRYDTVSCIQAPATNDDAKKRKAGGGTNGSTTTTNNNNNNNNYNNSNGDNSSESSSSEENFVSMSKKPREEQTTTIVNAKISRVYFRTEPSDSSLIVKDGYQWKKYGQKVTRDNPSPRAYFKCACAPSCPVKKKVQRSVEDPTVMVATYEGEHNHPQPCSNQQEFPNLNNCGRNVSVSIGSTTTTTHNSAALPTITLDLTKIKPAGTTNTTTTTNQKANTPEFQKFMMEQMASSLTKDPNFTAALVAAISGKFLNKN